MEHHEEAQQDNECSALEVALGKSRHLCTSVPVPRRYALKCVRKRDVVEKNVQDALVSELSILKEVPNGAQLSSDSFLDTRCV